MEAAKTIKEVAVKDTQYFYWVCEICEVAFFGEDRVLVSNDGCKRCPLTRGHFVKHRCLNQLYGGDEDSFSKYYRSK